MQRQCETDLKKIEASVALNQAAYECVRTQYKKGMTELDMLDIVKASYLRQTGEALSMVFDLIAGKRTGAVSGAPGDYVPQEGDAVILDLLPQYRGIYADNTRTFFIGAPSEKQRQVYGIVSEAIQEAETLLKPGTAAKEIHARVMEVFKRYQMQELFPHHAGHRFGETI